jgi:8-oxo-dGTP pyrophosphatase MutT (NUDIX family)
MSRILLATLSLTMASLSLGYCYYRSYIQDQNPSNSSNKYHSKGKPDEDLEKEFCSFCEKEGHTLLTCDKEHVIRVAAKENKVTSSAPSETSLPEIFSDLKINISSEESKENVIVKTPKRFNLTYRKKHVKKSIPSFATVASTSSKYKPNDKNHPDANVNCSYCKASGHDIKGCPVFLPLKKQVSKTGYVSENGNLLEKDELGCCAAGIFPYIISKNKMDKHVLLALEKRGDTIAFNFLGGRRDTPVETPRSIAKREFWEELIDISSSSPVQLLNEKTIQRLEKEKLGQVYWSGFSKFALFGFQLTEDESDLVERAKDAKFEEISGLRWFTIDELLDHMKENKKDSLLHSFTAQWLRDLHEYHGLENFA